MTLYELYSPGPLREVYHMGCGQMMGWTVAHREYERIMGRCGMCSQRVTTGETFSLSPTSTRTEEPR